MKKSLIALAAFASLAGTASAQSSVTIYGRINAAYSKALGTYTTTAATPTGVNDVQASRIGFKGTEDLGDGLKAIFNIEHQLSVDTGGTSGAFWGRRSVVGLEGGFGRVVLGREYSPIYTLIEAPSSPWGTDTVIGTALQPVITGSNVDARRYDNSITYTLAASGFTGSAQWAAKEGAAGKNPWGLGAAYAAGPIYVGLGYQNPANDDDHWTALYGAYDFGVAKLGALFGTGRDASDRKVQSWLLSVTAPIAGGQLRLGYGQWKLDDNSANETKAKIFGVGYHYSLSKRTTLFADIGRDGEANFGETGFDIGIRHDF